MTMQLNHYTYFITKLCCVSPINKDAIFNYTHYSFIARKSNNRNKIRKIKLGIYLS